MAKTLSFTDTSPQTVKIGDTTTSFALICGNDNVATDLTHATSITVKLGNASGYLKSATVDSASLTDPTTGQVTVKFNADLMTSLPAGSYAIEVWVVDPTGTSIYPSDGSTGFTITNNIQSSNGSTITTITFDDFVEAMNKAASTIAKGDKGEKGDPGDNGFYHYTVDLTDAKYDRNKWYYVETDGHQLGSLGGPSYFSLEAPSDAAMVPYGTHNGIGKGTFARQTVLYGQGGWGSYDRKLIVLDDQNPPQWTTDGKRLLTFAVPNDNNLNYALYARGGLKINITSDVPGLTWTPQTDELVVNDTTISALNDAPDPKSLGLDDDHTFWALPMSQLKQQLKTS
ncbi:hypothetical protein [Lactiplantibacillus plantarum]|uniref:hypothetical protein n=1 Tax=Lactiplantibacillus plantarum TaxID=1590 RepID=UPI000A57EF08|nr:hypothetical protein [Lactiplantibacillus plantarum]WBB05100.1 hypothetical protein O4Z47_05840 [Lactiplantibacillus plantarum]